MKCDRKLLRDRLISREIKSPRGSFYVVKFTYEEANRTRDNLVKYLYENLFEFVRRYVNLHLKNCFKTQEKQTIRQKKFIKIIDCFGFENSDVPLENSLENLFINYTEHFHLLFVKIKIKNNLNSYLHRISLIN